VVPSNIFAVSSVQLVDNGKGTSPLRAGAVIHEDQGLLTVLFQTTLSKFRKVLAAVGREPRADSVGWVAALGEATRGRGDRLEDAGRDLNKIVTQLNTVVSDDTGPSTIAALTAAANGLRDAAPELFDALGSMVKPMQTLAEKRSALTNFLSAGLRTVGTLGDGFDHQTDRLINMTTQLTPVMGVLADHRDGIRAVITHISALGDYLLTEGFNPVTHTLTAKGVIAFTPTRTYVRADCPRYGELAGPSCQTAPEVPVAPALTPALGSRGFPLPPGARENRPNLAPPRGSVLPPEAPEPAPTGEAPPPFLPAEASPSPAASPAAPVPSPGPSPPPSVQPQSTVMGGNVGPVGSRQEKDQLSLIVGAEANAATEFLLGPLARGTTVHLAPDPGGEP